MSDTNTYSDSKVMTVTEFVKNNEHALYGELLTINACGCGKPARLTAVTWVMELTCPTDRYFAITGSAACSHWSQELYYGTTLFRESDILEMFRVREGSLTELAFTTFLALYEDEQRALEAETDSLEDELRSLMPFSYTDCE